MQAISFTIRGESPLLMNRFHEEAQDEATGGVHTRRQDRPGPEEDAAKRLYALPDGTPYFPAENLRQSVITGAGREKIGRRAASTDMAAALLIEPHALTLEGTWVVDERPVVIPSTKGRIKRFRPRFDAWTISGTLKFDEQLVDEKLTRRCVDNAGNYVGIGDFRPAKKGPYGRFKVVSWS